MDTAWTHIFVAQVLLNHALFWTDLSITWAAKAITVQQVACVALAREGGRRVHTHLITSAIIGVTLVDICQLKPKVYTHTHTHTPVSAVDHNIHCKNTCISSYCKKGFLICFPFVSEMHTLHVAYQSNFPIISQVVSDTACATRSCQHCWHMFGCNHHC